MDEKELIKNMTAEERKALIAELQEQEKQEKVERKEAYEGLRAEFMNDVRKRLESVVNDVRVFREWLEKEVEGFRSVIADYGQLKREDQSGYTLTHDKFRLVVKSCKVKKFDERADMAAIRLVDYLRDYMAKSERGADDPMYQLAMTLLERNKQGDLDYKSVSKLYELEPRFDETYREIMDLFRESNVVQATAVNYYFYKCDEDGVWRQLEPSFCRL